MCGAMLRVKLRECAGSALLLGEVGPRWSVSARASGKEGVESLKRKRMLNIRVAE